MISTDKSVKTNMLPANEQHLRKEIIMKIAITDQTITTTHRVAEHLTVEQQRAYDRIPVKMDFVPHPSFEQQDTWVELFGPDSPKIAVPFWRPFPEISDSTRTRDNFKALSREEERHLFLKYNFARYRLAGLIARQQKRFSKLRAMSMIQWHEQILQIGRAHV